MLAKLKRTKFAQNQAMKATNDKLIEDLIDRTKANLKRVAALRQMDLTALNWKSSPDRWSVLECIEHLNRYARFYNPEIKMRLKDARRRSDGKFKSSWLGEYFAQSMLPKEKLNNMKTFTEMNPNQGHFDISVIDAFEHFQHELLEMLDDSRKVNLVKTKTSISISTWIKLRLGDTYRVVIYHNDRHLLQAENAIALMRSKER